MSKIKEKALDGKRKEGPFRNRTSNLAAFKSRAKEHAYQDDLEKIPPDSQRGMTEAGIVLSEEGRAGSYIQMDHSPVHCSIREEGVDILPIVEALKRYDGLEDYWWQAMAVDADKYTAHAELELHNGYFIRVSKGVKALFPVQACLYLGEEGIAPARPQYHHSRRGLGAPCHHGLYHGPEPGKGPSHRGVGVLRQARCYPHLHDDPQLGRRSGRTPEDGCLGGGRRHLSLPLCLHEASAVSADGPDGETTW